MPYITYTVLDIMLWDVGYLSSQTRSGDVLFYDPERNRWNRFEGALSSPRFGHAAFVVDRSICN